MYAYVLYAKYIMHTHICNIARIIYAHIYK